MGLVAVCAFGQAPARADSGWSIRSFDVQLAIDPDASLDVTETIDADFSAPKHGILREMPIRYAVGMHQYALRVRLRGVDDGEGRDYESSVLYEENLMRIRIGSPDYTVQGRRRYRLRYQVEVPSSGRATMPGRKGITRSCAGTPRGPSGRCRSRP